jgi:hypothetical protein
LAICLLCYADKERQTDKWTDGKEYRQKDKWKGELIRPIRGNMDKWTNRWTDRECYKHSDG